MKSVYVHIPFCMKKCLYCDFNSFDNKSNLIEEYFKAIIKEIKSYNLKNELETIYIGGGTPSFPHEKYIEMVLKELPKAKEITIEVNPGTITMSKMLAYKKMGINRLSIGLQAIQNKILKEIGRIHTISEFEKTYDIARKVGFENINVDLMHGLPNQTLDDFKESIDYLVKLNPEHISCYSLILHDNIFENLPSDEIEREMYYYAKKILRKNGYEHYEISNFSKPEKKSKHNLVYWNCEEYVGVGAGASSYINNQRYTNIANIEEYIKRIKNNENVKIIEENQTIEDKIKEYIIMKLRLLEGIKIEEINKKFNINFTEKYKNEIKKLKELNLIEINERIYLTDKGLDLANIVWEEFL